MENENHRPEHLRVAHVITQLELGGAQQNTLYTVAHLNRSRYEPLLISGVGGQLDEDAKAGSAPLYFIPNLIRRVAPVKDIQAFHDLYHLFRTLRPHIVHTHSSKAGILGRLAAFTAGVPVIIHTYHGFGFTPGQFSWVRKLFIGIERLWSPMAQHHIYVSEANQKEAQEKKIQRNTRCSIIRSGVTIQTVSPAALREELKLPNDAWIGISVGNFKPQKNPLGLVAVMKEVIERDPTVHFVAVGDGPLRKKVERFIHKNKLEGNIHLLGWRRETPTLVAAANAFVLASLWEGLPRAVVEAFVQKRPVVAYAVDGVSDIVIDGENGFAIPPHDVQRAAEKILWLKNHPDDARAMGQRGHDRVASEFDIKRMVNEQEQLYETLWNAVPMKETYLPIWDRPSRVSAG